MEELKLNRIDFSQIRGGEELLNVITTLFNKRLKETKTLAAWDNALITIIEYFLRKGNIADLKNQPTNYRPCFHIFKKILTKRLTHLTSMNL